MSVQIEEVASHVYRIGTTWANAFLIRRRGAISLVDSGSPRHTQDVLRSVRRIFGLGASIQFIAVSHCHADHIGNLSALVEATGAEVFVHPADAEHVLSGTPCLRSFLMRVAAPLIGLGSAPSLPPHTPVVTRARLEEASGLEAIHAPGHTPGHCAFYLRQERILFVGDAGQARGRVIGPRWSTFHDDASKASESLGTLREIPFTLAMFGHGGIIRSEKHWEELDDGGTRNDGAANRGSHASSGGDEGK